MSKLRYLFLALGLSAVLGGIVSIAEAGFGASCRGTMRSKMVGDSGPPLYTPIWAPVSHFCCCTCPPTQAGLAGTCEEVGIGAPVNGQQTTMCACVYRDGENTYVAVQMGTNGPYCDSQATRDVANPPGSGTLRSQTCAGSCPATKACLKQIDSTWTNDDVLYEDAYCDCVTPGG